MRLSIRPRYTVSRHRNAERLLADHSHAATALTERYHVGFWGAVGLVLVALAVALAVALTVFRPGDRLAAERHLLVHPGELVRVADREDPGNPAVLDRQAGHGVERAA